MGYAVHLAHPHPPAQCAQIATYVENTTFSGGYPAVSYAAAEIDFHRHPNFTSQTPQWAQSGHQQCVIAPQYGRSITAVRGSSVQGCAFHQAQALNRKAKHYGIHQHAYGKKTAIRVARWGRLLKKTIFLPKTIVQGVTTLRCPPMMVRQPAQVLVQKFPDYLHKKWYDALLLRERLNISGAQGTCMSWCKKKTQPKDSIGRRTLDN
ncbi:hypothetical protein NECAME_12655 [Necator americanus]|uniref:Uncharacterized protein n=1 Tax=Necator americanus TaxID=51031 RepID=W2SZ66_NECAM|nr:hypothetical protein NECAME_12655 [Necator americanus]ETN74888.1 hypothetical protein NECAME_12655 [Necator americanus]